MVTASGTLFMEKLLSNNLFYFFLTREFEVVMYKLQLDRELTKVLAGASKEIRDWVVNAIANIVVADNIIEKHEFVALQEAIGLLDNKDEIHDLMNKVKERKLDEVEKISVDSEIALNVFFYLAAIAVIDGNLKKSEADLLKKCGVCLDLENDLIRAVTNWSLKQMGINSKFSQDLKSSNKERERIVNSTIIN